MEKKNDMIFGLHAVIEAIEAGREIDKILIKRDLQSDLSKQFFAVTKGKELLIQRVPLERLNRITQKNHQGVVAFLSEITYERLENIVPALYEEGKVPFIVVLDGITDVRNFGAIARTCECAGVNAIVIPQKNSVTVNADAVKTSAGALHRIPVCRESSIQEALRYLSQSGIKTVAATEKSEQMYTQCSYDIPVALVMGSEDMGISTDSLKQCDNLVCIPQFGEIGSLNVSVATGVLIYEVIRQRQ